MIPSNRLLPADVATAFRRSTLKYLSHRPEFPPFIPIQDQQKLIWYVEERLDKGESGLPDVFDIEKMGFDRHSYVATFERKWDLWNQNLRGAMQQKDAAKATKLYTLLSTIYSNVLSYGSGIGKFRTPQNEYLDFLKSLSRDRNWYSTELDDLGIELHPDTFDTALLSRLQQTELPGGQAYKYAERTGTVQVRFIGMPKDTWKKAVARIFMMSRFERDAPATLVSVTLFYDSGMRLALADEYFQLPQIQERYNDGDNGVFIGGSAGYKLPPRRKTKDNLLTVRLVNDAQDVGGISDWLVSKGYRKVKIGQPAEGKRTYRWVDPMRASLGLQWVSPDEELGLRVINEASDLDPVGIRNQLKYELFGWGGQEEVKKKKAPKEPVTFNRFDKVRYNKEAGVLFDDRKGWRGVVQKIIDGDLLMVDW